MPLSLHEAHALEPGELLTFGGDNWFKVLSVTATGTGVHLELERDDGYRTSATHHDLDVAVKVPPPNSAPVNESRTDDGDEAAEGKRDTRSAVSAVKPKPRTQRKSVK